MQIAMISGTVGKDAELRNTQSGESILSFSLAVDNGRDKPATWWDCSIWGKRATSLSGHITKGLKLSLSGRPSAREHNGKAYLQLSVDRLTFMGGGQRQDCQDDRSESQGRGSDGFEDSEIPF